MDQKRAIAALGALAQETRLDLFRLLVTVGPEGLRRTPRGSAIVAVLPSGSTRPRRSHHATASEPADHLLSRIRDNERVAGLPDRELLWAGKRGLCAGLQSRCVVRRKQ